MKKFITLLFITFTLSSFAQEYNEKDAIIGDLKQQLFATQVELTQTEEDKANLEEDNYWLYTEKQIIIDSLRKSEKEYNRIYKLNLELQDSIKNSISLGSHVDLKFDENQKLDNVILLEKIIFFLVALTLILVIILHIRRKYE